MVTAARTISQIGMHMAVSFGVLYVLTGSVVAGGAAAVLEPVCNVILLPFHDRLWDRIRQRVEARQAAPGQPASIPAAPFPPLTTHPASP